MSGRPTFRAQHSIKSVTFHLKTCASKKEAVRVHRTHEWAYRSLKTKACVDFAADPDLPLYVRRELRTRLEWDDRVRTRLARHGISVCLPPLPGENTTERDDLEDLATQALLELKTRTVTSSHTSRDAGRAQIHTWS